MRETLKIRGIQGTGYEAMTDNHLVMPLRLVNCDNDYTWFTTTSGNRREIGIPACYFSWAPSVEWQEIPFGEIARKQA